MIEKNNSNIALALRYFKYRAELRSKSVDVNLSDEERTEARNKLQALPRDTSIIRTQNRCRLTGRVRGNYRKFGLCRNEFRRLALDGKLPGVTKASW